MPPSQPLCRRYQLLTQHKYYAPIPILLEIILFINKESGNLGQCAVLYGGVGNEILRRLFYLFRQYNHPGEPPIIALPNRVTAGMQWDKYRTQGVLWTACLRRPPFFCRFSRIKPADVESNERRRIEQGQRHKKHLQKDPFVKGRSA